MAGYSSRSLADKLGIKSDMRALLVGPCDTLIDALPKELKPTIKAKLPTSTTRYDYIHFFSTQEAQIAQSMPRLRELIVDSGMLWISWPKKAAAKLHKIDTDLTEDIIREHALRHGLVDVKVCAVDDVWSGLKLVIPVKDRKA